MASESPPIPIVVGFTGTQAGMTDAQKFTVEAELRSARAAGADRFVHGCCTGADEEAAAIARRLGYRIIGMPCAPRGAAQRSDFENDVEFAPRPPLKRNRQIARSSSRIIAAPRQAREVRRSGTWSAIRYSGQERRPIAVVLPDGSVDRRTGEGGPVELIPVGPSLLIRQREWV